MSDSFSLLTCEDEVIPSKKLVAEATMAGKLLYSKRFKPTPGKNNIAGAFKGQTLYGQINWKKKYTLEIVSND